MINKKKFDFVLAGYLIALIALGCIVIFSASTTTMVDTQNTKIMVETGYFCGDILIGSLSTPKDSNVYI
jgi:cell division protein FtsW (lipid II flippase)